EAITFEALSIEAHDLGCLFVVAGLAYRIERQIEIRLRLRAELLRIEVAEEHAKQSADDRREAQIELHRGSSNHGPSAPASRTTKRTCLLGVRRASVILALEHHLPRGRCGAARSCSRSPMSPFDDRAEQSDQRISQE